MRFQDIYGHEKVKNVLQTAVSTGQARHAYLFEGARGVGRLSTALAFAAALVCEQPEGAEPCGKCKSCMMSAAQTHPDIRVITNQLYDEGKKSVDVSVDTIRQMKREIYVKPYMAERKIYIVPRADTMTIAAQNSLLKVLEEPPLYCTIILIAENANAFLPTILSRVVTLRFQPLPFSLVEQALSETCAAHPEWEIPSETIPVKARMSGGSIGAAVELLQDKEADSLRDETLRQVNLLLQSGQRSIYDFAAFLKQNKTDIKFILNILQDWFHDVLLLKHDGRTKEIINADKTAELEQFCSRITRQSAAAFPDITAAYAGYINQNANYPTAVQCMAMEYWGEIHDRNYRNPL
uniref:DNA polymerase III subunit delta' n=1 Tax=uncultured Bacillota bacterium TaxID=344338 RepID=A0A650ENY8_9FIRM|nr:DNA polymerase III subunit delta' [uncultured Firmicutes bacterium]